jgi:hypothetical protein
MMDARRGYGPLGTVAWAVLLVAAGVAAVKLTIGTAPAWARGDFFDSPLLGPAFLGLSVLAAAAGWFVPRIGVWWGVLAASPFFVTLWVQGRSDEAGASFWPVGMVFLVFWTVLPCAAAGTASLIRRRRRTP